MLLLLWFGLKGLLMFELYGTGMLLQQVCCKTQQLEEEEEEELFICHIHSYTEYNPAVKCSSAFNPSKSTHTWSSGHKPGAVDTHTHLEQWTQTHTWSNGHTHTHLEQWKHTHTHTHTHTHNTHTHTHTHTHTPGAVGTHTHTPGAVNAAAPGEQLGVRCLAQGSHLSRGQFLPEPRTHNLRLQVQRSIH